MRRCDHLPLALGALTCFTGISYAIIIQEGPDSARGHPTSPQSYWPVGLVELPRHESLVRSFSECNGEVFHFHANSDQVTQLVHLFSETRMRDHELVIKERSRQDQSPPGEGFDYNVTLTILEDSSQDAVDKTEKPNTREPRLILYVNLPADRIWAERIAIPDNIIVSNQVAGFSLTGKATRPVRDIWHARVQFDDSTPAADLEHGVSTRVVLWEKGIKTGIKLGSVDRNGHFCATFSEKEIADLEAERSWLTLTAGNWLTEPKSNHPRLDRRHLSRENDNARSVTIAKPPYYYGRIIYEDGSPVALDNRTRRGLSVSFPYAGIAHVDSQGYLKVCFTEDQFEKAKIDRDRKNIYVPSDEDRRTAAALFVFPVSRLSQNQATAGVVRIPKPGKREHQESANTP